MSALVACAWGKALGALLGASDDGAQDLVGVRVRVGVGVRGRVGVRVSEWYVFLGLGLDQGSMTGRSTAASWGSSAATRSTSACLSRTGQATRPPW